MNDVNTNRRRNAPPYRLGFWEAPDLVDGEGSSCLMNAAAAAAAASALPPTPHTSFSPECFFFRLEAYCVPLRVRVCVWLARHGPHGTEYCFALPRALHTGYPMDSRRQPLPLPPSTNQRNGPMVQTHCPHFVLLCSGHVHL